MIFEILILVIPIGCTLFIAWFFKFHIKTEIETIFEENRKTTLRLIFKNLIDIDAHKLQIYIIMNDIKIEESSTDYKPEKLIYNHILNLQTEIKKIQNSLDAFLRISMYISKEQYQVIYGYMETSHSFLDTVKDHKTDIILPEFIITKEDLEAHGYFAKQIIECFDKTMNKESMYKDFKLKWYEKFNEIGVIHNVKQPEPDPGYMFGQHDDLDKKLLLDPQFDHIRCSLVKIGGKIDNVFNQVNSKA